MFLQYNIKTWFQQAILGEDVPTAQILRFSGAFVILL